MRNGYRVLTVWFALALLMIVSQDLYGRRSVAAPASPVHMVVTAEGRHGSEVPLIPAGEVQVYEGREKLQVTDWVPLTGERAGLEFFILIDDASSTSIGSQFEDLRAFMLDKLAADRAARSEDGDHGCMLRGMAESPQQDQFHRRT